MPVVIGVSFEMRRFKVKRGRGFAYLEEYVGRGVVTTATYEARGFGVHSGMALMKASVLAPEAILLPADFEEYRRYSRLFKAAVADHLAFQDRVRSAIAGALCNARVALIKRHS